MIFLNGWNQYKYEKKILFWRISDFFSEIFNPILFSLKSSDED